MTDFAGRHVVVTGGSGALGAEVVRQLIARGAHVHVPVYVPRELDGFPFRDHAQVSVRLGLDFTVEETVAKYYAELPSCWASIHVAGGFRAAAFTETRLEDFLFLMNVNAVTCFLTSREAVRRMRAGGGGRIVNVAARPALVPTAGMVAYAASKAVVASMTASLAAEVAGDGILVNAIAPSIIDTEGNRRAMPKADPKAWPKPSELAGVILQLASPQNAIASGAVVPVYGRA
ncbi:MAG: SDR family NAD(P)-dependent oxidoreductase [Sandaracinaceae bacterium]|nr:SDR family NAD(P)-dependent oxidoreductase [Sandaracinaceae bacterium]